MAKELPFFKFEPSQWENGNIQLCSYEQQGIFINLCSVYWQRLGDLPYKLALQKICNGNATALDSLSEEGIIKVIDGMICIDFLNEQLLEFENLSDQNSKNARSGWEKRRNNATVMRPHSERNAIREEEIREDKIKEKNTAGDKSPTLAERQKEFYNSLIPYTNQYTKTMVREFYEYWTEHSANGKKMRFEKEKVFDTARRLKTWAARAREEPKVLTTTQNYTGAEVDFKNMNRDAWEKIYEYSLKTDNEFRKHFNYAELQKGTPMGVNS